jgi:hypothetical protein
MDEEQALRLRPVQKLLNSVISMIPGPFINFGFLQLQNLAPHVDLECPSPLPRSTDWWTPRCEPWLFPHALI